jgi:hypothetical protein
MPKRTEPPTQRQDSSKRPKALLEIVAAVVKEFVGSALTVLSIYGLRRLVEWLLGGQMLWDVLPIKYCQDTVDAAVFMRFVWQVLRTFND